VPGPGNLAKVLEAVGQGLTLTLAPVPGPGNLAKVLEAVGQGLTLTLAPVPELTPAQLPGLTRSPA
jgi:hypothetical protein